MVAKKPEDRYQQVRNSSSLISKPGSRRVPRVGRLHRCRAIPVVALLEVDQSAQGNRDFDRPAKCAAGVKTEQTMTYAGPEVETDPKSEVVSSLPVTQAKQATILKPKKRRPGETAAAEEPQAPDRSRCRRVLARAAGRHSRYQKQPRRDCRRSDRARRQHRRGEGARRRLSASEARHHARQEQSQTTGLRRKPHPQPSPSRRLRRRSLPPFRLPELHLRSPWLRSMRRKRSSTSNLGRATSRRTSSSRTVSACR